MSKNKIEEDFYDRIEPILHRKIGRELRLARKILDIGCGACELVEYLASTYHQDVTGIDISASGFPKKRSSSGGRMKCIRKNAKNLNFIANEAIDAVVMMWAFHEMDYPDAILTEAFRVLRPGSEILIIDFPRNSLAQKLWNEDYYTPKEIEKKLKETEFTEIKAKLTAQKQIIWAKGYKPITK